MKWIAAAQKYSEFTGSKTVGSSIDLLSRPATPCARAYTLAIVMCLNVYVWYVQKQGGQGTDTARFVGFISTGTCLIGRPEDA